MHASRRLIVLAARKQVRGSRNPAQIAVNAFLSSNQTRLFTSTPISRTNATQNSWAVEFLEERGEKIPEGEAIPATELSDEALNNPSPKVLKLADEYLACNVIQSMQVWREIQNRLGITMEELFSGSGVRAAGAGDAGGAAAEAAPEPVKEKEAFDLKLMEVPAAAKIKVIKEVRAITGLGLKEAKEMVEGAPVVVKPGLKKDEAEKLMKLIVDAGAKAELV